MLSKQNKKIKKIDLELKGKGHSDPILTYDTALL